MDAFRLVYAKYRQRVMTYCLYYMGEQTAAEDAFQEIFTRAFTRRQQLREAKAITTWLISITRSVCLNMLRTSVFKPSFVSLDQPAQSDRTFAELSTDPARLDGIDVELLSALSKLQPIYREAILLCELEGYSYEEIARISETTVHNIQVRVTRAKQQLRASLMPSTEPAPKRRRKKETDPAASLVRSLVSSGLIDLRGGSV
jgi:RNA polymerase sigma-70 factor (ECF subfamily)